MRIEKIRQSGQQEEVLVTLEDGSVLTVTGQELLSFGLSPGLDLDEAALGDLRQAAGRSLARVMAARMIGRRALSKQELKQRLCRRGVREEDAQAAAAWLEEIGALDEKNYAELLVRQYSRMGYGPARLREELYRHGLPRTLWDEALAQAPAAEELIFPLVEKKLRGKPCGPEELRKLSDMLQRRGFSRGDIRSCLRSYGGEWEGED